MKIGILTFHYGNNYGGLLQVFALCSIIKKIGHQPIIINRVPNRVKKKNLLSLLKHFTNAILDNYIYSTFQDFRDVYLQPITQLIYDEDTLKSIVHQFDAVIVGSDQVWRRDYTNAGFNYFLDFVPENIIKVSYAASFGKENLYCDTASKEKIKKLLKRFNAVSIREDSGVSLCKKQFNVEATHLIDPTLLLDINDYQVLIEEKAYTEEAKTKYIAYYFLDSNDEKVKLTASLATFMNLNMKTISYSRKCPYSIKQSLLPITKFKYPSFSDWLKGIKNSKFVITDSFHGVIFSIIFKKQFFCIANKQRGLARMNSLLKLLGLTDRLIYSEEPLDRNLNSFKTIDYESVNSILYDEKVKAIDFLKNTLKY